MVAIQNQTTTTDFILLGFTSIHSFQILIFPVLLAVYLLTVTGNMTIVTITLLDRRLDTPMYFFLRNFSILEIGFTSVVIPNTLNNLLSERKTISVVACFIQLYFYFQLGITEFFLLALMSIDRYVAVCHPLQYSVVMNHRLCIHLMVWCWVGSFLCAVMLIIMISQLPFCGPNVIDHFFCDNAPLFNLACGDIHLFELIYFALVIIILLGTLIIVVISYANIVSTVFHLPSAKERRKAFSTCSSHFIVVTMLYGSFFFLYAQPRQRNSMDANKGVAILNTVVIPLLNPFIYSLRNKQVQQALREMNKRFCTHHACCRAA
uniref:Olfactory receptor n=1 Tax=Sphenodon punctatus TaxID=8508 RepID=A0A8D0GKQ1_SPHPU